MIGDEALNDFRDEDLVLNIEGLNVKMVVIFGICL